MWNRTPGYARAQGYGRDFGVGDTRNSREISLGIEFDKQGGILKYQDGNVLTPTGRAGVRKKTPIRLIQLIDYSPFLIKSKRRNYG